MARRPFRFGVQRSTASSGAEWAEAARKAEGLGYSTLHVTDHFGDRFAAVPALAAAAMATTTLRLGSYVFANDYRHPAVLAQEAATLDILSGGRLELGLGAGWLVEEYEQAGIPFDPPKVRVDRMKEGIRVLKALLTGDAAGFPGEYYRVHGEDVVPRPVQQPHPPLLLGGGGKRLLTIAAREADIVAFNTRAKPEGGLDASTVTAEAVTEMVGWVREAAGERLEQLELNINLTRIGFGQDARSAAEPAAADLGLTLEETLAGPHFLFGTPEQMADTLRERREQYGISYYSVGGRDMDSFAPVIRLLDGE